MSTIGSKSAPGVTRTLPPLIFKGVIFHLFLLIFTFFVIVHLFLFNFLHFLFEILHVFAYLMFKFIDFFIFFFNFKDFNIF